MSLLRNIRAEFIKLRHTAVLWIHILIPIIGSMVFLLYFALYPQVEDNSKMSLVMELTAVVFPIIISVVCGMMAALEEKTSFQGVMCNKDGRTISYLSKMLTAIILGGFSTVVLMGITMSGSSIFSLAQIPYGTFALAALGMLIGSMPLYIIHSFISTKWGLGCSVFIGVVECLLAIMFSNVDAAIWPFVPCAWGVKILQNIFYSASASTWLIIEKMRLEIIIIIVLSVAFLLMSFVWFQKWEGRKSFE